MNQNHTVVFGQIGKTYTSWCGPEMRKAVDRWPRPGPTVVSSSKRHRAMSGFSARELGSPRKACPPSSPEACGGAGHNVRWGSSQQRPHVCSARGPRPALPAFCSGSGSHSSSRTALRSSGTGRCHSPSTAGQGAQLVIAHTCLLPPRGRRGPPSITEPHFIPMTCR